MKPYQLETLAIRNRMPSTTQKEHSSPLFLTSSFTFDSAEEAAAMFAGEQAGNIYSRFSNPNTDEFVEKLVLLEAAETGIATASGMAAIFTTLAALLESGDHILASKDMFGNSMYIITKILPKYGITHTLVDVDDNAAWKKAVQDNTKVLFLETPSNPTLKIADLTFLGQLAKENELVFCVDNCFATPFIQQPVKFGADLVIHSATKYIDGQGRVLGGAIVGKKEYVDECYAFLRRTGASLSPFNAWILAKSLETLSLRMERHASNALAVAQFLEAHPAIEKVYYPGLESHPQYDIAQQQMKSGGGLVGCVIKGGKPAGRRFLNALKLHSLTANLGDSKSIVTHPASTTHSSLSAEALSEAGISEGYIRFSVGLEHRDDLISDIDNALKLSE